MIEHYTEESAADLLLEVTGGRANDCSVLTACLNAAISKIQASYTPGDKRIEAGDYVEIELGGGYCVDGIIDHVPNKSSDYWIIIEDDGCYRYFYNPPSIKLVKKGETQ